METISLVIVAAVVAAVVVAVIVLRRQSGVVVVPTRPAHAAAPGDEVGALLARGRKIEAIKLVRERTGMGLKEAKDYVDGLADGKHAPLPLPPAKANGVPGAAPSPTLVEAARALVAQGQKIEAIKLVREHTGWGLKEAKDYVDGLR